MGLFLQIGKQLDPRQRRVSLLGELIVCIRGLRIKCASGIEELHPRLNCLDALRGISLVAERYQLVRVFDRLRVILRLEIRLVVHLIDVLHQR